MNKKISDDLILGLVIGEGCFTFSTNTLSDSNGNKSIRRIPAFSIGMHVRDYELLEKVRDSMGLRNKVYKFKSSLKDGYNRGDKAILIVREFTQLKNIIIPFFYSRLDGYKKDQFNEWIKKIGSDESVPIHFKKLYWIHKAGFYDDYLKNKDITKIRDLE